MTTRTESLSFETAGGLTTAFVAMPEGETERAVILIHEWWGLNDQIKGVADRLARDVMGDDEDGEAVVEEAPLRPNPVTQDEMDAGSIELF